MTTALPSLEWAAPPPLTGDEVVAAGRRAPTARQQMVLDFMLSYTAAHGFAPTLREIGAHMGIRSTNGVNDHLKALERKGLIRRRDGLSRASTPVNVTPSADSFASAAAGWRAENEALRTLLGKVQLAATRLPKLTAEFVVLLGDIRDAVSISKDGDDHG